MLERRLVRRVARSDAVDLVEELAARAAVLLYQHVLHRFGIGPTQILQPRDRVDFYSLGAKVSGRAPSDVVCNPDVLRSASCIGRGVLRWSPGSPPRRHGGAG